ncbi:MAG: 2,3-bisphosphoglycerate-independent phosphoglycerate mutase, partial [candidate division WOR-3 bacterium]
MVYKELLDKGDKIILVVVDGLGGLPVVGSFTELELANIPNLDSLAKKFPVGALEPIGAGITPGSGPAHLSLFGYNPLEHRIGRGILEALGIDLEVKRGDVAIRCNFATVKNGVVVDRRAGRITTEENKRIVEKLKAINRVEDVEVIWASGKEHRFVLLLRGEGLSESIRETDPGKEGLPPFEPEPLTEEAEKTSRVLKNIVDSARDILKDEDRANFFLMRGYAKLPELESFEEKWGLKAFGVASYPMYRGLAKLVGMYVPDNTPDFESELKALEENINGYDFFYIHYKDADKAGEDGDWRKKVEALERFDMFVPRLIELGGIVAITGDHSTPALLRSHSWHYVPLLITSLKAGVPTAWRFCEKEAL